MADYVLTDGERFIFRNYQNKYVPTPSEEMADKFSKTQAEKILNNSLPKALRTIFRVEKLDSPPPEVKPMTKETLETSTQQILHNEKIQGWLDKVECFNGFIDDADKRLNELNEELSHIDRKISDILHYVECTKLNASQGYKVYKMLQEHLIERREIKNEKEVLHYIVTDFSQSNIYDDVKNYIEKLSERTYEPRELNDLFDF